MRSGFRIERRTTADGSSTHSKMIAPSTFPADVAHLKKLLSRYTYHPVFFPLHTYTSSKWVPAKGKTIYGTGWPKSYNEMGAVYDLSALADLELIHRIGTCICGKWFFAKFSHQRFCSTACRELAFRSSPEQQEVRRKRAREYYRLHRSGKVR